jgi:beta-glucuronidase
MNLPVQVLTRKWNSLGIAALVASGLFLWGSTGNAAQAAENEKSPSSTVLAGVDQRAAISLDGDWHAIVDPYATGLQDFHGKARADGFEQNREPKSPGDLVEYSFAKSVTLRVPGDWNTQRESLLYYEGVVWYEKDFVYQPKTGKRVFLHIGAANYRAYVWVNGQKICEHEGGFASFDCEATRALHDGNNFAVIAVDDTRSANGIPTLETDWWNYGGVTGDVSLVEVPEKFIDEFDLHLKKGTRNTIEGWAHVEGATVGTEVTLDFQEEEHPVRASGKTDEEGRVGLQVVDEGLRLWSPDHPALYRVTLASGEDRLNDEIGFRSIETRGTQILLNGEPIFLKGINMHAEAPVRGGRAYSEQDAEMLLGWAHELGANFVRLAHYPHNERMTRLADRMGLMVWSEIPVYWACRFEDPAVLRNAESQLSEMIRRDRDKASVILWSVANETPATAARTAFLTTLAGDVHRADPSRLVTAALLVRTEGNTKIVDDPLGNALDVLGTNEYVGWYEHTPVEVAHTVWDIRFQKPVIMSEFGAGAKAGMHGAVGARWTEEFQANLFEQQFLMLNQIPQLRGICPWVLVDFRSPRRLLPEIQDGYNRKGLISDKGEKKKAFFVVQKAYQTNGVGRAQ